MEIKYDKIVSEGEQSRAIVMIHGWQGNKNSFKAVSKLLKIENTTWFFPEAPYDFEGDSLKKTWTYEKYPGVWELEEPKVKLRSFFKEVVFREFSSENVFVIGFSQGAAVCYEFILSLEYPLGGVFPIAGFIRDQKPPTLDVHKNQCSTPILIGHGKNDEVVALDSSKSAYAKLQKICSNVTLDIYNGGHKINLSYLNKVKELILTNQKKTVE